MGIYNEGLPFVTLTYKIMVTWSHCKTLNEKINCESTKSPLSQCLESSMLELSEFYITMRSPNPQSIMNHVIFWSNVVHLIHLAALVEGHLWAPNEPRAWFLWEVCTFKMTTLFDQMINVRSLDELKKSTIKLFCEKN